MPVKSIKLILIVDSLILRVFKRSKRDTEAILGMFESYFRIISQRLSDDFFIARTNQGIMNLQVLKIERDISCFSHISWIEDCKAVRASENKSTI